MLEVNENTYKSASCCIRSSTIQFHGNYLVSWVKVRTRGPIGCAIPWNAYVKMRSTIGCRVGGKSQNWVLGDDLILNVPESKDQNEPASVLCQYLPSLRLISPTRQSTSSITTIPTSIINTHHPVPTPK